MLLPAVQQVREAARRASCSNNIRQIALACHNYQSARDELPGGLVAYKDNSRIRWFGYSVFAAILPQMEQTAIYDQWDYSESGTNAMTNSLDLNGNRTADATTAQQINSYICPSDVFDELVVELTYSSNSAGYPGGFFGVMSYAANGGTNSTYFLQPPMQDDGVFYMTGPESLPDPRSPNRTPNLDDDADPVSVDAVYDGSSNTFMFGEKYHLDPVFEAIVRQNGTSSSFSRYDLDQWSVWGWYGGGNGTTATFGSTQSPLNYSTPEDVSASYTEVNNRTSAFGSGHSGGANFAFCDGSVRFVVNEIDEVSYQSLSTREGGETVYSDL
jgi:prepilin-type processing-associated H-X9-DG protein